MKEKNLKIGIVGFGRFGKVLYEIFKEDFEIVLLEHKRRIVLSQQENVKITRDLKEFYSLSEVVFFCVPIGKFESVVKEHSKYIKDQCLVDVLSVKVHPKKVFLKYFSDRDNEIILTHPMFGPDSIKLKTQGLPIVMHSLQNKNLYNFFKIYFENKKFSVVEIPPEKHDKLASMSQGVAHFIGRLLSEINFKPTIIDTLGARKLQEVMKQTCNDTWELFKDLQLYNPYTRQMRSKVGAAYERLIKFLVPKSVKPGKIIFGIQGGKASFNEQAILQYIEKNKIKNAKIKYLYTSEAVLSSVEKGRVDYGLFAVHNSQGGIVWESARALAKHKVEIVEEFSIPIRHFLMKRKDVAVEELTHIIAHPQVFKQCKKNLSKKYPQLKQVSGEGRLVDTAAAAEAVARGELPKTYAVLGPVGLASLYDFDIIEKDLQDDKDNLTYFFLVRMPRFKG